MSRRWFRSVMMSGSIVLGPLAFAAGPAAVAAAQSDAKGAEPDGTEWESLFPEGEGRDYVTALCQSCHSLKSTALGRRDAGGWRAVVVDMNAKGADLFTEDAGFIVKYLAEHFNTKRPPLELPVNLNTSSSEQLGLLAVLTSEDVAKIEAARAKRPFRSVTDLKPVLSDEKIGKIKPFVVVR